MDTIHTEPLMITRAYYKSADEIYICATGIDHQVGDPEGMAIWDGRKWNWIRQGRDWIVDLDYFDGRLFSVDFSGKLTTYYHNIVEKEFKLPNAGYNCCCVHNNEIYLAGIKGQFCNYNLDKANSIDLSIKTNIYACLAFQDTIFVGGEDGLLLSWKNGIHRRFDIHSEADVTSMCVADEAVFAAAGKRGDSYIINVLNGISFRTSIRMYSIGFNRYLGLFGVDSTGSLWSIDTNNKSIEKKSIFLNISCIGKTCHAHLLGGQSRICLFSDTKFQDVLFDLSLGLNE